MPAVALITGAAQRIGRCITETLHTQGYNVVAHYHRSADAAEGLIAELNQQRPNSAIALQADLLDNNAIQTLAQASIAHWGRLDLLVNNASTYYPTPVGQMQHANWSDLLGSNIKAPALLSEACAAALAEQQGAIVNLIDSNVLRRPIANHAIYSAAKAGLHGLTLALAKDLAPRVRVNGVSPGAILWAENETDTALQQSIIDSTALGRNGRPEDIANAVLFLAQASYITGYVMKVDGGKNVS